MNAIIVRPIEQADLRCLNQVFGSEFERTHADDLADQQAGLKTFLVAWDGNEPVGHALISWQGPRTELPQSMYPHTPEIYRLAVLESHQRRGIATQIVHQCETQAANRGFNTISLGTDPELSEGDNLYYRLGYTTSRAVNFDESYKRLEANGSTTVVEEKTTLVIKSIDNTRESIHQPTHQLNGSRRLRNR